MRPSNVAWLKIYLNEDHLKHHGERQIVLELRAANNKRIESRYFYPDNKRANFPLGWESFEQTVRHMLFGADAEKYALGKRLTVDVNIGDLTAAITEFIVAEIKSGNLKIPVNALKE